VLPWPLELYIFSFFSPQYVPKNGVAGPCVVVQSLIRVQLFVILWSTPGLPVPHYLTEFAQVYVRWISDAIQSSHPLPPSSPFAFSLSQHQNLFPMSWPFSSEVQSIRASASVSVFPMNINRVDFLWDWLVWYHCYPSGSHESSLAPQFKSINSWALSLLYGPTLTSVHDYWKNHSFKSTDLCWQNDVSAF